MSKIIAREATQITPNTSAVCAVPLDAASLVKLKTGTVSITTCSNERDRFIFV
jgi:hypothetical protein